MKITSNANWKHNGRCLTSQHFISNKIVENFTLLSVDILCFLPMNLYNLENCWGTYFENPPKALIQPCFTASYRPSVCPESLRFPNFHYYKLLASQLLRHHYWDFRLDEKCFFMVVTLETIVFLHVYHANPLNFPMLDAIWEVRDFAQKKKIYQSSSMTIHFNQF